jgi:hypothetical protein
MVMKKVLVLLVTATVISVVLITSLGVVACADETPPYGYQTPAPESHDGDPEGSGFDGIAGSEDSPGPAPNSGDGIPDGSGF